MALGKVCIYTESPIRQDAAPTCKKRVHHFAEVRHRRIIFEMQKEVFTTSLFLLSCVIHIRFYFSIENTEIAFLTSSFIACIAAYSTSCK